MSESKHVWVFLETEDGQLRSVGLELLGQGRLLADKMGEQLVGVILDPHAGILPEPEPFVRVSGYGESNIDYVVRVWCKTADYWTVYYDLMEAVGAAFDAHGVSMSYPQMNVHVLDTPESAKKD